MSEPQEHQQPGQQESGDNPVLRIIRHDYLGQSKMGPGTVRERPLPETCRAAFLKTPTSDKKHFYLNSSKGSIGPESTSKLRSVQLLRRAKIRKPIKTTGESDAKIRMPPPKFPPPRFIKKKKPSSPKPTGAMLKPTLEPVENSGDSSTHKNHLNFVPFELPKVKSRTAPSSSPVCSAQNILETDTVSDGSKRHEKSGRAARLAAYKARKQNILKKLRPDVKVEESDESINYKRMRKLVDSWAQKLGSLAKKHECLQKAKPKPISVLKNTLTHPTKAQLKQTESPEITALSRIRAKNRFLLGKHKSWMGTYQRPYVVPSSTKTMDESSSTSGPPVKAVVCSNPIMSHTIELLRYKRDAESCSSDLDAESLAAKIESFPVIPHKNQKPELLLENIPLSTEEVRSILMKRLSILVAHSGYTHVKLQPMELLADSVFNFMQKLAERLKQVTEREAAGFDHGFPDPMERVLVELGMGGVRGVEEYYQTKVKDYHRRMLDQCNFIRKQYDNMLQSRSVLPNGTANYNPSSSTTSDVIIAESEKAIPMPVQSNGLESSTVTIMLKETLSQHNILRLNFEDAPSSSGAQLNDTKAMTS